MTGRPASGVGDHFTRQTRVAPSRRRADLVASSAVADDVGPPTDAANETVSDAAKKPFYDIAKLPDHAGTLITLATAVAYLVGYATMHLRRERPGGFGT